ncbi:Txe/YoeB family addiction module toxin [Treponema denticola]|uniref:Txe/YoeB family addiction module toxin n=1 Tax=Treponema denticola TaxID=158 RepID=UPI002107CE7B|nr:Txe/YoeB family addiction module toxin [Treponema denticola]UTY27015.1 Txe/YoeB family addiction module toxin [Treponema denticola]
MWTVVYSKQAAKDSKKIEQSNLKESVKRLIEVLKNDPFQNPPPYEKLIGDLTGKFSRRINLQHRLVYEVFGKEMIVRVLRMWTHYE